MKDEEYLFYSDVREKKNVARSAFNRRTHNGKRGGVKFPSDYKTQKELLEINGKVESYRLNAPMTLDEFKVMPDDIKQIYLKSLRQKFNVPYSHVAEMLGCTQSYISREIARLGLGIKKGSWSPNWDKEGWIAFVHGVSTDLKAQEEQTVEIHTEDSVGEAPAETEVEEPMETAEEIEEKAGHVVPNSGTMTMTAPAADALKTVVSILGFTNVKITVSWEAQP